jgi:hypothetical protein
MVSAIGTGVYVPAGGYFGGTATGLVNAPAITLNANLGTPTLAQLEGVLISFIPNLANTATTPTLAVNGLAATTIVKGTSTALASGDLALNTLAFVVYNGTNFQLINPQAAITQSATSAGSWVVPGSSTANSYIVSTSGAGVRGSATNVNVLFQGGVSGSLSTAAGSVTVEGSPNTGTGSAGSAIIEAGPNTGTGPQGFANVQQSFTVAAALAATFEAVSITTTGDQIVASAAGSLTNVGIAQTVGGTGTQLFVVTNGKTTARFDGTPVIGDVACYPPATTGAAGLLHDNGTLTACTLGESAGIITGQVSGSTATILIR